MIAPLVILLAAVGAREVPVTPVGMPGRLEQLVLKGPLLETRLLTDRTMPLVVRIVEAYPHGDSYRYDIEYYGLERGTFDLRDYLRREDGSYPEDLSPIEVEISSSLPPGQVLPHDLVPGRGPSVGGYKTLLMIGGVLWVAGLFAILLVGRKRKVAQLAAESHLLTLNERLQAAIQAAGAGTLRAEERAELERMVLAHWRRRLGLEEREASEAVAQMRRHPQARVALEQLERWLHDPSGRLPDDFQLLVTPVEVPETESPEQV